jgi:putative transposase
MDPSRASAARKVVGDAAFLQRCTLHKRRNVRDHLRRLAAAFNHDDPANDERGCRDLAAQLEARWPDATASPREGLEDMFTVRRLGVGGRLAASLTNCIERMLSIARRRGDQTLGSRRELNAERSFRRLKGYRQMPRLRRCPRPSPRSCSTGMRCCTSRMSGRTDAPPPSGRDSKLDAQTTSAPES